MPYEPQTPRKRLRLAGCSYRYNRYYFITICTSRRECLFGDIVDAKMRLNAAGRMILRELQMIPNMHLDWLVDAHIVMPNHIHAIFCLNNTSINQPAPLSLPELIRNLKSVTTLHYVRGVFEYNWQSFDKHLWQRSYHDHIIRNEQSLNNIREYIRNNPAKWLADDYNQQM